MDSIDRGLFEKECRYGYNSVFQNPFRYDHLVAGSTHRLCLRIEPLQRIQNISKMSHALGSRYDYKEEIAPPSNIEMTLYRHTVIGKHEGSALHLLYTLRYFVSL